MNRLNWHYLKTEGVDLIDCSSGGGAAQAKVPVAPGYQISISEAVRNGADILTAKVGMIIVPALANEIIRNGRADLVLLSLEMLRDPYWPLHTAETLKRPTPLPLQYLRAF